VLALLVSSPPARRRRGRRRSAARRPALAAVATNGATLALGVTLAVRVLAHASGDRAGGVLRADALSAFMVVVIGAVALLASWLGSAPSPSTWRPAP